MFLLRKILMECAMTKVFYRCKSKPNTIKATVVIVFVRHYRKFSFISVAKFREIVKACLTRSYNLHRKIATTGTSDFAAEMVWLLNGSQHDKCSKTVKRLLANRNRKIGCSALDYCQCTSISSVKRVVL